jgi:hypothetical protein
VEAFVNYLPVSKDRVEARITYARFVRWVNTNRKFIFGENLCLLPKVVSILVTIVNSKLVEKSLNPIILQTLQAIKQNLPAVAVNQAIAMLTPDLKQKLSELK